MNICVILDNFGAGEGFSMKIDNADANKIPPSFFAMFFCSVFFNPQKKGENPNLFFPLEKQYMKV